MSTGRVRPDLLSPEAPDGVEVVQLTTGDLPSSHVYMEAQIFCPDSKRFVLHESARAHGSSRDDPNHRYLLCDLEDGGSLCPLTEERGATGPSLSPDGTTLYYFIDETELNGGRLSLKSVGIDGTDCRTLMVLDIPPQNASRQPSRPYPLSTIRSDGKRIALSCFFGDGNLEGDDWGLMVFDLERFTAEMILSGPTWCNAHPQYCRSSDDAAMRDILVQENHGNTCTPEGDFIKLTGGAGADIHVIRDDGTDLRDMPWGRDGNEACQGHQCWRGETSWAITATATKRPRESQLIEGLAAAGTGEHRGILTPEGLRNDLSRSFETPSFSHFATDRNGRRLVSDTTVRDQGGRVFLAMLNEPGESALSGWTCLACPRSSWQKEAHIHPFLSPDGEKAFFNSDESGIVQAYMIQGLENLPR